MSGDFEASDPCPSGRGAKPVRPAGVGLLSSHRRGAGFDWFLKILPGRSYAQLVIACRKTRKVWNEVGQPAAGTVPFERFRPSFFSKRFYQI